MDFKFQCNDCPRKFSYKSSLLAHAACTVKGAQQKDMFWPRASGWQRAIPLASVHNVKNLLDKVGLENVELRILYSLNTLAYCIPATAVKHGFEMVALYHPQTHLNIPKTAQKSPNSVVKCVCNVTLLCGLKSCKLTTHVLRKLRERYPRCFQALRDGASPRRPEHHWPIFYWIWETVGGVGLGHAWTRTC